MTLGTGIAVAAIWGAVAAFVAWLNPLADTVVVIFGLKAAIFATVLSA